MKELIWLTCLLLWLCGGHTLYEENPFLSIKQSKRTQLSLDTCFCELQGPVEECCCDVETVNRLNQLQVYPLANYLTGMSYFRFFKVDLLKECPFWQDDSSKCVMKGCHVEPCSEEEVPVFLKATDASISKPATPQQGHCSSVPASCSCDEDTLDEQNELGAIDSTISSKQQEEFDKWKEFDDSEVNFCELDDEQSRSLSYVDLSLNPERYTGYAGPSADRIWKAIYRENCFLPEEDITRHSIIDYSRMQGMCLEKRAFYRLISGMHTSITIHLTAHYLQSEPSATNPTFGPNFEEFNKRFDPQRTASQGPLWLKNLYFTYLLVLRAITKGEPLWESESFFTGNNLDEKIIKETIRQIVRAAKSCPSLFDETQMFNDDSSIKLKSQFKQHFRNISRIMDCVGCEKCRLWGKVQVRGIGTALKILFNDVQRLKLHRTEIVSLFNALGRFSSSINQLNRFRSNVADQTGEDV
ncbi:ERO1-like protein beta isoform X3 [Dysidea avara]|uniref:ERO1-like protein beta isoform X3 n=1 Tax=Dysidea avara TaxID=196820 RepID=UPI0033170163